MAKERNKPKTSTTTAKQAPHVDALPSGAKNVSANAASQRLITGGIIAVALVAVIVFIVLIVNAPAEAPIPDGALTRYDGIQQTRTQPEGYPRLGDPNAPVQVAEYSSFDCPHCRDFHDAVD